MRLGTNPTPTQLAELDRWLRDPEDPRTPEQIRADLEFLGEVASLPTFAPRVWPTGLRWMARWFR